MDQQALILPGPVCLCVCVGLWVCAPPQLCMTTLCTMHLCCAPLTCVVHHDAMRCICLWVVGVVPYTSVVSGGTFIRVLTAYIRRCTRAGTHSVVFLFLTTNTEIKVHTLVVHNVALYWCTRRFCMFVMDHAWDGAQYNVVSLAV